MPEEPVAPAPAVEPKVETIPKEEFDKLKSDYEAYKDESESKIENLQDSLDSALEDVAMKSGRLDTEDEEDEPKAPVPKEPEIPEIPKEREKPIEGEVNIEKEIESAIKEDQEFKQDYQQFKERTLLKEEAEDLRDELSSVLPKYPEADKDRILRDIEDGIEEGNPRQVEVLAKASHEARLKFKTDIKTQTEEELRAKLKIEQEGGKSVPQSQGTPSAPSAPTAEPKGVSSPIDEDLEWGEALGKAKSIGPGA